MKKIMLIYYRMMKIYHLHKKCKRCLTLKRLNSLIKEICPSVNKKGDNVIIHHDDSSSEEEGSTELRIEDGNNNYIPLETILVEEAEFIEKLWELQNSESILFYIEYIVGGKKVGITKFSYPPQNHSVPTFLDPTCRKVKLRFKQGFVNTLPTKELYRYELMEVVTFVKNDIPRVFYSMCMLNSGEQMKCSPHRFILLAILMTLCKDGRFDYLVWDSESRRIFKWQHNDFISKFWCEPWITFSGKYYCLKN